MAQNGFPTGDALQPAPGALQGHPPRFRPMEEAHFPMGPPHQGICCMPLMLQQSPIGSSRRLQLQVRRPPRPKRSLTPNRTLTRRPSRAPSQLCLNPSLRLSTPLSLGPNLPLRPFAWRLMPERNPPPNPQPSPLPKPTPRPRMGVKHRPRPLLERTRQAPALRLRAARTSKDKGQRRAVKWTRQIEN